MSKKVIKFVTSNSGKFEAVKKWAKQLDNSIIIEQANIDAPEYQSLDITYVAQQKAKAAWEILKQPLIIEDGGLYLEKYNNFPGPLTKYVLQGIGFEGLWTLTQDNSRAYFLTNIVYIEKPDSYHFFEGLTCGRIIKSQAQIKTASLPLKAIFVPDGTTKTYDQLNESEEQRLYHRLKALKNFIAWLKTQ